MSIQSSDLFLINRGGVNYKISYSDLLAGTGVEPTDLIMVQRGGALYEISYQELGITGATLGSTDYLLIERDAKLYSQRINGQLIAAGAYYKLGLNTATASDQSNIVRFGWKGGLPINGVPPQIVNAYNGKVAFLGDSGEVSLDATFCQNNEVRVYGQFDEMKFAGSRGLTSAIISTNSAAGWTSMMPNPGPKQGEDMFDQCPLLSNIDSHIPLRNMTRFMRLCVAMNDPIISSLDVSQVTTLRDCFNSCRNFNQPLGSWNTSNVESMTGTFVNCRDFNQNINAWSTGKVTDFSSMFIGCDVYNQPLYLWDTSSVVSFGMNKMFFNALVFNKDLKPWCVSAIRSKPSQFSDNSPLSPANEPFWGACP